VFTIVRRAGLPAVAVVLALVALSVPSDRIGSARAAGVAGRPDIVFILTDDQSAGTLWAMPAVQDMAARGMSFDDAIISDPLCCPSRASILTGRYAGGHGVWSNRAPFGWPAFHANGDEDHTIATALHAVGYRTGLVGKYLNRYDRAAGLVPTGWDRWFAFNHTNGRFYDYDMVDFDASDGITDIVHHASLPADYSTDVIGEEAVRFIETTPSQQPLFLYAAVSAPHRPSTPAPGDIGTFNGRVWPHAPSFNEADVSDKPQYIRSLGRFSANAIRMIDQRTQAAMESLLAVDRMVADIVEALRVSGRLGNTMLVFMSDNGFLHGEHRWDFKTVPYEESIRVPLVVRFDPALSGTVRAGTTSDALVSNVDLAPTWAALAGATIGAPVDGVRFDQILSGGPPRRKEVLLESIEIANGAGGVMPAYCGLRMANRVYVRYATGEEEFYRLASDPFQLRNRASDQLPAMAAMRDRTVSLCQPVPPGFSWLGA
jgi:N-acetylglucosamine-6-sulfatase